MRKRFKEKAFEGKFIFSIFVIVLSFLVCIMLPCNTEARSVLKKKKSKQAKVSAVFFGDSYGTHPFKSRRWPFYLRKALGLTKAGCKKSIKGGSGFCSANRKRNFVERLKKMKRNKRVRIVLIVGGVRNDLKYPEEAVLMKMKEFDLLLSEKFPNAKICYALPNYTKEVEKQLETVSRKTVCRDFAASLGWHYLESTETCLYGQEDCFEKDGHHPNKRAQKLISEALLKDLESFGIDKEYFKRSVK